DGGGSSAMWVRDRIVNQPSDLIERPVANHLAVRVVIEPAPPKED
ncbi:MAG: Phosphodiester glycosidase, partial [Pseudomonadota bacterium]|nr:Phosphodiester glycosidase [Pseudomonadota bacterium]